MIVEFTKDLNRICNITNTDTNSPIVNILLKDRTTNKNILNTNNDSFISYSFIPELVPRALRDREVNKDRSKSKAEIFTPIRIVNQMNTMVLKDWFESKSKNMNKKSVFEEYIDSTQMEITCGEGVFLCTRYDSETGDIIELKNRVGLLDHKLHKLIDSFFNRNNGKNNKSKIDDKKLFYSYLIRIAKSMYGYEYQGDSLLMARINNLISYIEYYSYIFGEEIEGCMLEELANIISWNIFQMDGLTQCIPQKEKEVVVDKKNKQKNYVAVNGIDVKIMNWKENKIELFGAECGIKD